MTKEEKMLLIKDLSARLPYAVTVEHTSGFRGTLHDITVYHVYDNNDNIYDAVCYTDFFGDKDAIYIEYFKPYLFPLSSMTEEQKNDCPIGETNLNIIKDNLGCYGIIEIPWRLSFLFIDWCNKNHFDYRGLIPKGLAIDATGKNIY